MVYASSTLEAWDQKLVDDIGSVAANLGLQTCLFSWLALASAFRALYHHEWIPSTIGFLIYTLFGQLIYYQNSPLILYPATMVTNLVTMTKYFLSDIYGAAMGSFCFNFAYTVTQFDITNCENCSLFENIALPPTPYEPYYPGLQTTVDGNLNCNSSAAFTNNLPLISSSLLDIDNQQDQLVEIGNTTVATSDLNCGGAKTLNILFLVVNYLFVGITIGVLLVLIRAEVTRRTDQATYRQRYFVAGGDKDGEYMVGVKTPHALIAVAFIGFITFQSAKLDASLNAIDSSRDWPLIDVHNMPGTYKFVLGQKSNYELAEKIYPLTGNAYVKVHYDLVFNMNGWLPSKKPYLNIDTILLIVTTMSVIRGGTRQSISAFRMASVSSALYVVTTWPIIVGNMANMQAASLWPWENQQKCHEFFTGTAFLYPDDEQSKSLCTTTQLAMFGSLVVFMAMNLNIFACLRVFIYNRNRMSLTDGDIAPDMYDPIFRSTRSATAETGANELNAPLHENESSQYFVAQKQTNIGYHYSGANPTSQV